MPLVNPQNFTPVVPPTFPSTLALSSGSSLIGFIQAGTGAVARTLQDKNRDILALADFSTSGNYDTAKGSLTGTLALPFTEFINPGVGLPQIKLFGTATRYATFRAGSDGTDDGDLYFQQTGDNVWMQSLTNTYRCTLSMVPKGTVAISPANLELYGTDRLADGTNFERLRIHSMGTGETENEIASEKSGTGTARPIHILISGIANGIFINNDANNGAGTKTPRKKWDILDPSNAQLRLSHTDNSVFADFRATSTGAVTISQSVTTPRTVLAYSATVPVNAALGYVHSITPSNGSAFTIANPTNPVSGQAIRIRVRNTSGGALGVLTWDTLYKLGAAWNQPANGFSRAIDFDYDGANWVEANRSAADVAN